MSDWNNLPFVHALGWATLNSLGQMAFLWLCWWGINKLFLLSNTIKYILAVSSVITGFALFVHSFLMFYLYGTGSELAAVFPAIFTPTLLPIVLSASSLAYLSLLCVPSFRLLKNWRLVQKLQRYGLAKVAPQSRLFVKMVGLRMGITHSIQVYLSEFIASPVTVGFIKPVILLPVSVMSQLTPHQLEAILVHELAHIKRHDYLTNLLLTCIHAVMYFNPFVKLFLKAVELTRESSCDETVLRFGYDKISYASALLEFEKSAQALPLALGAANKNHLLHRIETIVGISKSRAPFPGHLMPGIATLVFFIILNTILFQGKQQLPAEFNAQSFAQPASFFVDETGGDEKKTAQQQLPLLHQALARKKMPGASTAEKTGTYTPIIAYDVRNMGDLLLVAFNGADASLDLEQKSQVRRTLENTKKVLESQWKKVDQAIGDAMTNKEKQQAQHEYLKQIESIDWKAIEKNLAANYEAIDWEKINGTVTDLMATATLDSLENCYSIALEALNQMKDNKAAILPMPDVTLQQLKRTTGALKDSMKVIQKIRSRKIVRL
ncbi:MAG: M56 family metallopeptidase [Chitinophagaceae bacterium]